MLKGETRFGTRHRLLWQSRGSELAGGRRRKRGDGGGRGRGGEGGGGGEVGQLWTLFQMYRLKHP